MPTKNLNILDEDPSHQIVPATNAPIETALKRSGLSIRKEGKHVAANPLCVNCNAPPACRGVAPGKNCPANPTGQ